jgi:hypothetical protein
MFAPLPPEVSFAATERPRCPRCHLRMIAAGLCAGGFRGGPRHIASHFECPTCDRADDDPMKSNAAGWLNSDLKPPE